jgi:hypothetical protein
MASFKEAFAAARKEKGAGKTFTYKGKSYSTNYAEEEKKPSGTKPKAKPAGLNPVRNPNATSVTNKVNPKPVRNPNATSVTNKVKPKPATKPATTTDTSFALLKSLQEFLAGGGMTGADQRKKAAEKAARERR